MAEVITNILGIFLGALIGIPAGLALNHAWEHRVDSARRKQLRSALKETVDKNLYLIEQIKDWLSTSGGTPFFNVDLTLVEATATIKYEILNDIELCREIDTLRFELTHLSRKINVLLELEFNPSARMAVSEPESSFYLLFRPKLVDSVRVHLEPITRTLESLKTKLQ
jgi:hypothetical protein